MGQPCKCGGSGVGSSLIRQLLLPTGKQLRQPPLKVCCKLRTSFLSTEHALICRLPMFCYLLNLFFQVSPCRTSEAARSVCCLPF